MGGMSKAFSGGMPIGKKADSNCPIWGGMPNTTVIINENTL